MANPEVGSSSSTYPHYIDINMLRLKKIAKELYDWKSVWQIPSLPRNWLEGRSVAVVGPADSVFDNELGDFIDSFDDVVRINQAIETRSSDNRRFLGDRTTILFHTLDEDSTVGCKPIDRTRWVKAGVKQVVIPSCDKRLAKKAIAVSNRDVGGPPFYRPRLQGDRSLRNDLGPSCRWPTTGMSAIYHVLTARCRSVYITGFTFYRSRYMGGYRDAFVEPEVSRRWIKQCGNHDPDAELRLLHRLLLGALEPARTVQLDPRLTSILNSSCEKES